MSSVPIRAVTLGVAGQHPLAAEVIAEAAGTLARAAAAFRQEGFEVQTERLSTRPLLEDLARWDRDAILAYAADLQAALDAAGVTLCSIGPAPAWRPDFDLERSAILADALVANPSLYGSLQLAPPGGAQRDEAADAAADVVVTLSRRTPGGVGNFRFAALACVPPGAPFFPAGYHEGPASLAVGWQGASLVSEAVAVGPAQGAGARIGEALATAGTTVVEIGRRAAAEAGIAFGGIDLSPAPNGADSIARALEALGGPIGGAGSLTAAALVTTALRSTGLPACGYSGLMLPVMEDDLLAERWATRSIGFATLLAHSAVCGTGLDAVPLPGDASRPEIAGLMRDVATLATRLGKPLSARLLPAPGVRHGEMTRFDSPHLLNTRAWSAVDPGR